METKNVIIQNYARSIVDAAINISNTAGTFNDNVDENTAIVRTLDVLIESLRSQTAIIQSAIDTYHE